MAPKKKLLKPTTKTRAKMSPKKKRKNKGYLTCPECRAKTAESSWQVDSEECELCGPMTGIACPKCKTIFTDCSWSYPERTRE